jgi:DNA-binding NarL/FixJ family response regulator
MDEPTRILLVDDHEIVREGLRVLFGRLPHVQIVAEAQSGRLALERAVATVPDLAIVDLHLPDIDGLELIAAMTAQAPDLRVIVLSADGDHHLVQGALRLGVQGYVLKGNSTTDILNAVDAVLRGQVYFSPEIATRVAASYRQAIAGASAHALSERETDVLKLLADGKSSKDIAGILGVGVTTVDTHRHHIMKRLGLFSVAELTKYAIREGLTKL